MAAAVGALSADQREAWHAGGYVVLRHFVTAAVCAAMLERAVEICREPAAAADPLVLPEARIDLSTGARPAEAGVSKVFRLHRDPVFARFAHDDRVVDLVSGLLGPDIDVFLSQFIFKNPGAYGQPWHQDSFYFPFEPDHQIGVWLAVTAATLANGCLWVLPGSHTEPVHRHLPDRRPDSQYGYLEIADHDMGDAVPVLMDPGDLLLFDSHLMHRSTDNHSTGLRAATVYHYSPAGTSDLRAAGDRGDIVNDWVSVRRATG
jgi:ectoine hydroxylase-related dioxygenase (phytanoyl-CoA dioxygenase family)